MLTPDDNLQFLTNTGKQAIETAAKDGEEYIPTLIVEDQAGIMTVIVLAGDHPFDMLGAVLPTVRGMRPRSISFSADSFIVEGPAAVVEPMRAKYGGSLMRAFNAGEPSVRECLIINVVTPDSTETLTLPYVRTNDTIVWLEPKGPSRDSDVGGRMIDALRTAFVR